MDTRMVALPNQPCGSSGGVVATIHQFHRLSFYHLICGRHTCCPRVDDIQLLRLTPVETDVLPWTCLYVTQPTKRHYLWDTISLTHRACQLSHHQEGDSPELYILLDLSHPWKKLASTSHPGLLCSYSDIG